MKKNLSAKKQSEIKMDKAAAKTMPAKKKAQGSPRQPDLSDIDWQAVARGEIKLKKEQEAAAMDAWAAQADAKAAQAAAKYSTIPRVDSAKIKAYLDAQAVERAKNKYYYYDFFGGNPDLILRHVRDNFKTTEEKLEYLRWTLMQHYGSPEYVLKEEIASIKRRKEAEEFLNDPVKFKRRYTRKITPANKPTYELTYFEEPDIDFFTAPWLEINKEIELLQTERSGLNITRRLQDIHFGIIEPYLKNPDTTFSLSGLSVGMNLDRNTFYNWYTTGHKIHPDFDKQQWQQLGYETAIRTGKLLLRVSPDKTTIMKKDIVLFLKFIGKIRIN